MRLGGLTRSSRAVLAVFLGVATLSSVLLAALGWVLLRQDHDLVNTRSQERRQQAADRLAAQVLASFSNPEVEAAATAAMAAFPSGSLLITLAGAHLSANRGSLLYYPYEPIPAPEASAQVFEEGERLEYRVEDHTAAAREYGRLTTSPDAAVRAGALGRLARVQRKLLASDDALATYDRLAEIQEPVSIDGFPAALYARLGRAGALERANRTDTLREEARALLSDLRQARWALSRPAYEARREDVGRWLGVTVPDDPESRTYAEAVEWLWQNRDSLSTSAPGVRDVQLPSGQALVAWATDADRLRAGIAGPAYLASLLEDVRAEASSRRLLLAASLAAIGLVLLTGWYFILRAMAREQRTAQLQNDFVSAVSHEFRSPLTSMAHLAEMLEADRFPSDESRRTSYGMLVRDTGRLRRLVEDLLDFRRFESGTASLHLEPVDLVDVMRTVVADVQDRVAPAGYRIELSVPGAPVRTSADREALSRALGNLLDNAVKYSPECRTVWVEIALEAGSVAISVRDEGIGIPNDEQGHIFDRFVRGAEPKAMRIKGTGIGLAMVRHIARAHGGDVRVASEPGRGSRFTIVLREAAPFDVARGSPAPQRAGVAS